MDSSNLFGVRMTKAGIVSDWAGVPLSRDEAISLAVWLVAVASPGEASIIAEGFDASRSTRVGRMLRAITHGEASSAIAD